MKRYFVIIYLAIFTLIIFLGVKLFYKIVLFNVEKKQTIVANKESSVNSKIKSHQNLSFYDNIIERNLFKTTKKKANVDIAQIDLGNLAETKLSLKLYGTVIDNSGNNRAIIEESKNGKQQIYRAGDKIQNAKVKLILREKVILTLNGKDEILEMEKSKNSIKASFSNSNRSSQQIPYSQNISLNRTKIEDAFKNATDLMRQVRIQPHFINGKSDGFIITSIKQGSLFREMGLVNGDIIKEVDGNEIRSLDDAIKLHGALSSASSVSLRINRRGREKLINYKIQ